MDGWIDGWMGGCVGGACVDGWGLCGWVEHFFKLNKHVVCVELIN